MLKDISGKVTEKTGKINYMFPSKPLCHMSVCKHPKNALLLSESECLSFKVYELQPHHWRV